MFVFALHSCSPYFFFYRRSCRRYHDHHDGQFYIFAMSVVMKLQRNSTTSTAPPRRRCHRISQPHFCDMIKSRNNKRFEKGRGVAQAVRWYRHAAAQGHTSVDAIGRGMRMAPRANSRLGFIFGGVGSEQVLSSRCKGQRNMTAARLASARTRCCCSTCRPASVTNEGEVVDRWTGGGAL